VLCSRIGRVGAVINIREVDHALKHLHDWMKIEREPTPVVMQPAHVRVRREPLGVTLIIGAWNEPFMLTLGPLIPAVAAGNTAVIKPSGDRRGVRRRSGRDGPKYLDAEAFAVVQGAVPETTALLAQQWDMIFFTGSPPVGKIVHQAAAQHLTPAVLELGGKNPTIVHSSADVKTAARRIAFGRYANSGHICTAPDHVLVWAEVKDELVAQLRDAIHDFYGDDPEQSPDYGRVINRRNFDRLAGFLDNGTVAVRGGRGTPRSGTSLRPCSSTSPSTLRSCRTRSSVRSCRCSRSTRSRR
jgi:aldehyde dehydrogenase (NAD+)